MKPQHKGNAYSSFDSYRKAVRRDIERKLQSAESLKEYVRALEVLTGIKLIKVKL